MNVKKNPLYYVNAVVFLFLTGYALLLGINAFDADNIDMDGGLCAVVVTMILCVLMYVFHMLKVANRLEANPILQHTIEIISTLVLITGAFVIRVYSMGDFSIDFNKEILVAGCMLLSYVIARMLNQYGFATLLMLLPWPYMISTWGYSEAEIKNLLTILVIMCVISVIMYATRRIRGAKMAVSVVFVLAVAAFLYYGMYQKGLTTVYVTDYMQYIKNFKAMFVITEANRFFYIAFLISAIIAGMRITIGRGTGSNLILFTINALYVFTILYNTGTGLNYMLFPFIAIAVSGAFGVRPAYEDEEEVLLDNLGEVDPKYLNRQDTVIDDSDLDQILGEIDKEPYKIGRGILTQVKDEHENEDIPIELQMYDAGTSGLQTPEPAKTEEPVKAEEPVKTPEPVKAEEPAKTPEPVKAEEPEKAPEPVKTEEPEKAPEPVKTVTSEYKPEKAEELVFNQAETSEQIETEETAEPEMPDATAETDENVILEQEFTIEEPLIEEDNEDFKIEEPVIGEEPAFEPIEEPVIEDNYDVTIEEPVIEESVVEDTIIEEPVVEEQVVEEPIVEEPIIEEPVVEEPIIEESAVEEPVIEEPVVEEPIIEEPIVEEPVVEEPIIEEPVEEVYESIASADMAEFEMPAFEMSESEETDKTYEPVITEPVVVEPVIEEPVAESVIEEQTVEEPVEEVYESIASADMAEFEMPTFEMPEFKMPEFEMPEAVETSQPETVENPVTIENPVVIENPVSFEQHREEPSYSYGNNDYSFIQVQPMFETMSSFMDKEEERSFPEFETSVEKEPDVTTEITDESTAENIVPQEASIVTEPVETEDDDIVEEPVSSSIESLFEYVDNSTEEDKSTLASVGFETPAFEAPEFDITQLFEDKVETQEVETVQEPVAENVSAEETVLPDDVVLGMDLDEEFSFGTAQSLFDFYNTDETTAVTGFESDEAVESAEEPATEEPTAEEPEYSYEEPALEEPAVEEPAVEEPVTVEPEYSYEEPAAEEPAVEETVAEEPVEEEVSTEVYNYDEPAAEKEETAPVNQYANDDDFFDWSSYDESAYVEKEINEIESVAEEQTQTATTNNEFEEFVWTDDVVKSVNEEVISEENVEPEVNPYEEIAATEIPEPENEAYDLQDSEAEFTVYQSTGASNVVEEPVEEEQPQYNVFQSSGTFKVEEPVEEAEPQYNVFQSSGTFKVEEPVEEVQPQYNVFQSSGVTIEEDIVEDVLPSFKTYGEEDKEEVKEDANSKVKDPFPDFDLDLPDFEPFDSTKKF
ncbi:MAG: hypothetical protein ACI4GD_08420 [Lachnospiraceae bacterium]